MSEVWKDSKQPKAKEVEKKAEQPDAEGPPAPAPQETLEGELQLCLKELMYFMLSEVLKKYYLVSQVLRTLARHCF